MRRHRHKKPSCGDEKSGWANGARSRRERPPRALKPSLVDYLPASWYRDLQAAVVQHVDKPTMLMDASVKPAPKTHLATTDTVDHKEPVLPAAAPLPPASTSHPKLNPRRRANRRLRQLCADHPEAVLPPVLPLITSHNRIIPPFRVPARVIQPRVACTLNPQLTFVKTRVSEAVVIHAFLINERHKPMCLLEVQSCMGAHMEKLLERPDFTSAWENHLRKRTLMSWRREVWNELPSDTRWFRIEIHVSDYWQDHITAVWPRVNHLMPSGTPVDLNSLIVWTPGRLEDERHDWYVVEGNHRVVQWKMHPPSVVSKRPVVIYGGESTSLCRWIYLTHSPVLRRTILLFVTAGNHVLLDAILAFLPALVPPPPLMEYHNSGYTQWASLMRQSNPNGSMRVFDLESLPHQYSERMTGLTVPHRVLNHTSSPATTRQEDDRVVVTLQTGRPLLNDSPSVEHDTKRNDAIDVKLLPLQSVSVESSHDPTISETPSVRRTAPFDHEDFCILPRVLPPVAIVDSDRCVRISTLTNALSIVSLLVVIYAFSCGMV